MTTRSGRSALTRSTTCRVNAALRTAPACRSVTSATRTPSNCDGSCGDATSNRVTDGFAASTAP